MDSPSPDSESPPPPSPATWRYLTRVEATGLALLPGGDVSGVESYAQVMPMLVVAEGEAFGLNLGAPVRLRLAGGELGAGLVRREDWDSLSDWGQLVHALKLGSDTALVGLWVGALEGYSLLSGHLVRRYSNRANPDYHPAGASLTGSVGPLYVRGGLRLGRAGGASHGCPSRGGLAAPLHCPAQTAGPLHPGGVSGA